MGTLTRDQIFAAPVPTREVEVPEWGGSITVRSLSPRSRTAVLEVMRTYYEKNDAYEADQAKPEKEREGLEKPQPFDESILSVIFSVVGEDMKPIFTMDDYDRFMELGYPTIQHIYKNMIMLEVRAIDPPEEQKKSSGTTRKRSSSSVSQRR